MANQDRVSEVYKGEYGDFQDRVQDRIHWMCQHAEGAVLDLGCSQGIASILLGREGFSVVGVDVERDRIDYARTDLAKESDPVQARVDFRVGDGTALETPDESFGTVLLGEVLEHLLRPELVLAEVARVLQPEGRLVLTTPFGYHPHHDHRTSFFAGSLSGVLTNHFALEEGEIVDGYFRIVARKTNDAEEAVQARVIAHLTTEQERLLVTDARTARSQRTKYVELEQQLRASRQELQHSVNELHKTRADLGMARQALATQESRTRELEAEVSRANREGGVASVERSTSLERQRIELANEVRTLSYRLQVAQSRRWWLLGDLLLAVKRDPKRLVRLPFEVLKLLVRPVAQPRPPELLPMPGSPRTGTSPAAVGTDGRSSFAGATFASDITVRPRGGPGGGSPPAGASRLRVASILDEMSASSFAPDCDLVAVPDGDWRPALDDRELDLLLVESAWNGNGGAWQYCVGSYSHPDYVGLPQLRQLLSWAQGRGLPTVFWNKEDPVHFDKFTEAACLFDVILTTDADVVSRYRALPNSLAHTVAALPFAAQPATHNPTVEAGHERRPRPCFAGAFYRNRHPERREQLEQLLDAAAPFDLDIYDRRAGEQSTSYGFPERFQHRNLGRLPYAEMARIYKEYRVFLNANSVTESPTMFSRRVFELLASGTPVVSTPSTGVDAFFPGLVATVTDVESGRKAIERLLHDEEHWAAIASAGVRQVMAEHTYAHRLATIAGHAGLDVEALAALGGAVDVAIDSREGGLQTTLASVERQSVTARSLTVVASETPSDGELGRAAELFGLEGSAVSVRPMQDGGRWADTVPEGSRHVMVVSGAPELAKQHLADVSAALRWTPASVIGRPEQAAEFVHGARVETAGAVIRTESLRGSVEPATAIAEAVAAGDAYAIARADRESAR